MNLLEVNHFPSTPEVTSLPLRDTVEILTVELNVTHHSWYRYYCGTMYSGVV